MAVKKSVKLVTKHSAIGVFIGIDNNKIIVEDEKTGINELDLEELNELVGKKISINISSEKELDPDVSYNDDEEDVSEEEKFSLV